MTVSKIQSTQFLLWRNLQKTTSLTIRRMINPTIRRMTSPTRLTKLTIRQIIRTTRTLTIKQIVKQTMEPMPEQTQLTARMMTRRNTPISSKITALFLQKRA